MRQLDRLPASMRYSLRYLKARLRILKRPAVWGSTALMLLILVGFAEYWRQSEGNRAQRHSGVASLDDLAVPTPSEADSAIGADIDTLPLLLDEFDFGKTPIPSPPAAVSPSETNRPPTTAPLATPAPVRSTERSGSLATNPDSFNLELPRVDLLSGITSLFPTNQSTETAGDRPAAATPAPSSPLQTAIQRYGTPLEQSVNASSSNGSSPVPLPTEATIPVPQSLPTNPQPVYPVAPLGTPSYTLPPSLRSVPLNSTQSGQPNRSYVDSFTTQPIQIAPQLVPPSAPLPLQPTGQYPSPTHGTTQGGVVNPSYSIAPPPTVDLPRPAPTAPFSVPNRVPGRYIGNGEFNTFSNP